MIIHAYDATKGYLHFIKAYFGRTIDYAVNTLIDEYRSKEMTGTAVFYVYSGDNSYRLATIIVILPDMIIDSRYL